MSCFKITLVPWLQEQSRCFFYWGSHVVHPHMFRGAEFFPCPAFCPVQICWRRVQRRPACAKASLRDRVSWFVIGMQFLQSKCHTFFYLNMENGQSQGMGEKNNQTNRNEYSTPKLNLYYPGASFTYLEVYLQLELKGTDCNSFSSLGVFASNYPFLLPRFR